MRLDRYARSWKDSRIVGHERVVPMDQMIAMGYSREQCLEYVQSQAHRASLRCRRSFVIPGVSCRRAWATKRPEVGQWYIKADQNGDGQPELRYICTMGEDHDIVSDEEANRISSRFSVAIPSRIPSWAIALRTTPKTSRKLRPT